MFLFKAGTERAGVKCVCWYPFPLGEKGKIHTVSWVYMGVDQKGPLHMGENHQKDDKGL